jgi:hypothetical protein
MNVTMLTITDMITKAQAIAAYGGNASDLARALKIRPQAVYQWGDDEPIPDNHELRLKYELRPEVFGPTAAPAVCDRLEAAR